MEPYIIVPHARVGTYKIMAAEVGGKRTLVATYPTEEAAVTRLRALQKQSGIILPEGHPSGRERC